MGAILNNTAYEMPAKVTADRCKDGNLKISELMKLHERIGELHLNVFGSDSETLRNEHHIAFVFTKARILIHRLPGENEDITVRTWCSELKGARFIRNYQTFGGDGSVLTESKCEVTVIDMISRKITRPSAIPGSEDFLYNNELENGCERPKKLNLPENMTAVGVHKADDRDIDDNQHVNNTVYADIMAAFTPDNYREKAVRSVEISFISEVLPHEDVAVFSAESQDGVLFSGSADGRAVFSGALGF